MHMHCVSLPNKHGILLSRNSALTSPIQTDWCPICTYETLDEKWRLARLYCVASALHADLY